MPSSTAPGSDGATRTTGSIWILGGDRPVETDAHRAILAAMARGLRAGDGGAHLITLHPSGGQGSATWVHDEPWLDFNMRQNGHGAEFTGKYDQLAVDYARTPAKPVLDGEPIYEDHPIAFDAARFGHSIAADVRRALYWDLFSGAFGHTYGHHSVWQFWDTDAGPDQQSRCCRGPRRSRSRAHSRCTTPARCSSLGRS